jgi:DNA-binding transcriptional MerR regulator
MTNHNYPVELTQKLEETLRSLGFGNQEIAQILARLELAITEEIGKEALDRLSKSERETVEQMIEEKRDLAKVAEILKTKLSPEEIKGLYKKKVATITGELQEWAQTLEKFDQKAKEEIYQGLVETLQQKSAA